jgi:hypothetical protein
VTAPMTWQQISGMASQRRRPRNQNYSLGGYTQAVDETGANAMASGQEASDAYVSRAENFDASKALNTWAQGAYSNISTALTQRLRDLSGQAVGSGRLNTGFFDEDQGAVVRGAQQDFSSQLAQQALGAASLQSSSDKSLGEFGLQQTELGTDIAQSRREEMINAQREEAARKRAQKRGIGSLIGGIGGAAIGGLYGGVGGAKVGYGAGSALGGVF